MGIASTVEGTTTAIGAVWDFADSAVNAWTKYYGEALNADMTGISADLKRQAAGSYLDQAASATRHAGQVQQAGMESAVNRYLRLGRDIGHIYAGAAGGNIDVSSNTVRDVDRAARLMANRDVAAISRSAANQAQDYSDAAKAARISYIGEQTAADMMDINAEYSKKIARSQMRSSMWSAAGKMAGTAALGFLLI